ncbi:MAG: translocation/assembly module TamB domain-containing protein [Vicinamibacterales bacterium]
MKVFSGPRLSRIVRYIGGGLSLVLVLLAAAITTSVTVDLGPSLRALAERGGSSLLRRPVHIGALRVQLFRGRVEVGDLVVDGLTPRDRPFFTAKRIAVTLDWSRIPSLRPELIISSVELDDWQMLVEKFKNTDNFPRFRNRNAPSSGPRRFTATTRYLRGTRGTFIYEDHDAPWGIMAPGIDMTITNFPKYHGEASFKGGTVSIQNYLPMWADFRAFFTIDGSQLQLTRIDMNTDGAVSTAVGAVDMDHWPEQSYNVTSRVQFKRMRELFFAHESWRLGGEGDFKGVFHLFKGGHDLSGHFTSEVAELSDYRFPSLFGGLHWTNHGFHVTDAGAQFSGGRARFGFSITPLGSPTKPTGRFDATYDDVDVAALTDFYDFNGLRVAGRASGRNLLEWPMGRFKEHRGDGQFTLKPPPDAAVMSASLDAARAADPQHSRHPWGPFAPIPLPSHVPVSASVAYRYGPDIIDVTAGHFATGSTHVSFAGRTAWAEESDFHFHVTSRDWQESDQVLAGILTDFGARTDPVAFGGRGEFDGRMTGAFRRPRVEGTFSGEDMRAWDTVWGEGSAQIVVENSYVTVTDGVVHLGDSKIHADGLFSLGYPRKDGGEEINARIRVAGRDLEGLRHAFELDEWPVTGSLTGEFSLNGRYQAPFGSGAMTIDNGVAYKEPFQKGTATLRFDGTGVRLDAISLTKATGTVSGAAFVGWDGTYSFNADGRRIPVEHVAAFAFPAAQPSGLIEFTAAGSATFDEPRYDVRYRINELFVAREPVGLVTGTLALRGDEVNGELDVSSARLSLTGAGRIALDAKSTADLTFRFHDSSFDPYVRVFVPKLSPHTTTVANGSIHVAGQLADVDHLLVDGTIDRLEMTLFDYAIRNARPIRIALDQHVIKVQDVQLEGDDTRLTVGGTISLHDEKVALRASGNANLGILQGFFPDVRGAGRAQLAAAVDGALYTPDFSGSATISNGRIRHFSLPNALEEINGTVRFDSRGVRLDDVSAMMGGGRIQFGGRIGLDGYLPGELNVTVRGDDMHLRYPEGIRSTVEADLSVRGNVKAPTLAGRVTVKSATWNRRVDPNSGFLDFGNGAAAVDVAPTANATPLPLRLDIEVLVPSTLRIENNLARLVASADLRLRGTYDRPLIFGRAEVDRGEVIFEGRRYLVTRGTIDFTNPTRIEPFLDLEALTRVRVPGQTYQVTVRAVGTVEHLQPELSSDPPLPAADVLALLFSDSQRTLDPNAVELGALTSSNRNELERDIIRTRATQILANPVSSEVGRIVEQTFGVDTFQLTPSLIDPYNRSSRVNPSARVTIGKRISDRVYLTFSRSLSSSRDDQIVLLEYDENDRLSWILSRNEDSTYAIEVRVRHSF